jgi:hypothetical protein
VLYRFLLKVIHDVTHNHPISASEIPQKQRPSFDIFFTGYQPPTPAPIRVKEVGGEGK